MRDAGHPKILVDTRRRNRRNKAIPPCNSSLIHHFWPSAREMRLSVESDRDIELRQSEERGERAQPDLIFTTTNYYRAALLSRNRYTRALHVAAVL